jgi:hypothetical protein
MVHHLAVFVHVHVFAKIEDGVPAGTVGAFYLSNVEQYLYQDGKWDAFCRNVATLPLDQSSTFIRSQSGGGFGGRGFINSLGRIEDETKGCR